MSNWIRRPDLDEAFNVLHGIKPQVYVLHISERERELKFCYAGREVTIKETTKDGLINSISIKHEDQEEVFNFPKDRPVLAAEEEILKILKGE